MIDMNSRLKAHSHGFGHEDLHVGSPWNFKSVYVRVQHGKGGRGGEQWEGLSHLWLPANSSEFLVWSDSKQHAPNYSYFSLLNGIYRLTIM